MVKSERANQKKLEKNRALRRKKRIALSRASKYSDRKYGSSKQWIAKNNEDDRPRGRTNRRSKDRYYDLKSKREKYNSGKKHSDKYDRYNDRYTGYDDYYYDDGSYGKSGKNGYRGSGGGGGRGTGRRHKRGKARTSNGGYYGKDEAHFSGYSRRKGHQTWAKAK